MSVLVPCPALKGRSVESWAHVADKDVLVVRVGSIGTQEVPGFTQGKTDLAWNGRDTEPGVLLSVLRLVSFGMASQLEEADLSDEDRATHECSVGKLALGLPCFIFGGELDNAAISS